MIARLCCFVRGHKYVVERLFSPVSRKIGCARCGSTWAMHDGVRTVVPWTGEFEEMYRTVGQWPGIEPRKKTHD